MIKKIVLISTLSLFLSNYVCADWKWGDCSWFYIIPIPDRESHPQIADWCVEEARWEECIASIRDDSTLSCIDPIAETSPADNAVWNEIFSEDSRHFTLDYSKSLVIDPKHAIKVGEHVLSIRQLVLKRDYERNSLDGDSSLKERGKKFGTKYFQTVHVLGLWSGVLTDRQLEILNESATKPDSLFQDSDEAEKRRDQIIKIFKIHTDTSTHKMLKGPFKGHDGEEEWHSESNVPAHDVCYEPEPCGFFDIKKNVENNNGYVFVLFYSGDLTTSNYDKAYNKNIPGEVRDNPENLETEYDDYMGFFRIPVRMLTQGAKYVFIQRNPSEESGSFDFAAVLEVASIKKTTDAK